MPRHIFEGTLPTTFSYDSSLAEVLSEYGNTNTAAKSSPGSAVSYKIDDSVVRRVVKFCGGVILLSQIHVLLRLAGKGSLFSFETSQISALPDARPSIEISQAIRLYDKRVAAGSHFLNRTGTVITSNQQLDKEDTSSIFLITRAEQPFWARVASGRLVREHAELEVFYNFIPSIISVEQLRVLNSDPRLLGFDWIQPEVGALFILLIVSIAFYLHFDNAPVTLGQYGYCLMDLEMFKITVDERITEARSIVQQLTLSSNLPTTSADLLHTLETCSGSIWPLQQGSPIRRDGELICVDLYAATARLDSLLEFPHVQGKIANARAAHFELAAQAVIDDSPWCPGKHLKQLRGRKLRYENQDVTDIDAIGEYNGTLLMVSCKSMIYSSAYDAGEYAAVKNKSDMINLAVTQWEEKRSFLAKHKLSANYDFRNYQRLLAVVCTPSPIYVSIGPATREIAPHLFAVTSLYELGQWLRENK
ncbi:MAG TPA: hypothetical protein VEQ38_23845 [Verrucomicrobiae bacterium]|nr:hypothetical protein [Verrucomicrobiae bacterium]